MDPIPINYGPWLSMSDEGLTFLQSLMLRSPAQRMSAAEALEHPWFTKQFADAGLSQQGPPSTATAVGDQDPASVASAASDKSDHRNNIVPMSQQQHQHLQSHNSLHSKPHVLSM